MLPFDRRVVQLYGSCTQHGNILLVLEFMKVTLSPCNYLLQNAELCVAIKRMTFCSYHDSIDKQISLCAVKLGLHSTLRDETVSSSTLT